jgi:hypothetical protein
MRDADDRSLDPRELDLHLGRLLLPLQFFPQRV